MADETKLTAATRIEKLLDNIAGGDNEVTPATRLEKFLSYIADAMEGGGGSGGGGCKCLNIDISNSESQPGTIYKYVGGEWVNSGFSATQSLAYSGDLITAGPVFLTSEIVSELVTYGNTDVVTLEMESDSSQTAGFDKGYYVLEDNVTLQLIVYADINAEVQYLLLIPEGVDIVYRGGLS